jgi:hypothetical protein
LREREFFTVDDAFLDGSGYGFLKVFLRRCISLCAVMLIRLCRRFLLFNIYLIVPDIAPVRSDVDCRYLNFTNSLQSIGSVEITIFIAWSIRSTGVR